MERLEDIVATNLTELRKAKKWTQAELAEKINYSDKSVSKWERGEGLPDLKVLKQMADLFGVTLDFFTTEDATKNLQEFNYPKSENGFRITVELLVVSIVWMISTILFFYSAFADPPVEGAWLTFIWAVPVSSLLLALFSRFWKYRISSLIFTSIFLWSFLTGVFLQVLIHSHFSLIIWMIFLIGIPAQVAIVLWSQIRHRKY